ncbi:hypothetical protein Asi02nite_18120 [Asanoa siamensis]|uniref:Alanine racemase n=1 Tax=Asanoa siamensis TaxID=926357 RepID=A0ABQ4CLZ1_9ACTN|nr:hypothetical protein Asi02nite_18120 [Asanoa siamensis]
MAGWAGWAAARVQARIDLDALRANVRLLAARAGEAELMVVVKADAYGHGLVRCARAARSAGAAWLATAVPEEALALRAAGIDGRLLAWLWTPGGPFAPAVAADIDVSVSGQWDLASVAAAAASVGRRARVHLKIDSGLGRNGAPLRDWPALVRAAAAAEAAGSIRVVGIWSHLAMADEPGHPSLATQSAVFAGAVHLASQAGLHPSVRHLANSAATLLAPAARLDPARADRPPQTQHADHAGHPADARPHPAHADQRSHAQNATPPPDARPHPAHADRPSQEQDATPPPDARPDPAHAGKRPDASDLAASVVTDVRLDLVRVGLAAYGLSPAAGVSSADLGLRPVMTLASRFAAVKRVPAGQGVGYGLDHRTRGETTLGLVPVGYADGIPRSAGNVGEVWAAGKRRAIVGRISMDQFVVDLGDDPAAPGDEVLIFGPGDRGEPTAEDWARAAGTISYEIVARIGPGVPRIYSGDFA